VTGLASPTHPVETRWYSNADPLLSWPGSPVTSPAVKGYSYMLDQNPGMNPDTATLELPVKLFGFAPKVDYAAGALPMSVVVGDFNRDGKQDLATAKDAGYTVAVLLGNGDGTFGAKAEYAIAGDSESIAVGDFNRDGKQDLATANWQVDTVSVLLGGGDGGFPAHADYATGDGPLKVAVGDFNSDGSQDLVTANYNANTVTVLLGRRDGTFRTKTDFPVASHHNPQAVAVGDFNGDGKQDLAAANQAGTVSIMLGNDDGTFGADTTYPTGASSNSIAVSDFDNNGKLDLVTGQYGTDTVSVLLGDGAGAFAAHTDYATGTHPYGVSVGDLNSDNERDLLTANATADTVSVLMGGGGGTFSAKTDFATGTTPLSVAVGDFDADGQPDLATANENAYTLSILLNDPNRAAFTGQADGIWYFHVRAVDNVGNGGLTATCAVRIDTRSPRTKAPYRATVVRGHTATLKYKVTDPRPGSPTANVTIRIKTLAGKTVKTLRLSGKAVNKLLSARFRCRLAKKTYRFKVYATDQAGNEQASAGSNTLRVR